MAFGGGGGRVGVLSFSLFPCLNIQQTTFSLSVFQAADPVKQQQNNSRLPASTQRRPEHEARGVNCGTW